MESMKVRSILLFSSLLWTTVACNQVTIDPAPEALRMQMVEVLSPDVSRLQLFISTEREYECGNYNLDISLADSLIDQVNITVNGVEKPRVCLEAIGTASNGVLLPSGEETRTFTLTQGEFVSTGVLRITDSRYFLDLTETNMLTLINNELVKVPSFFYWGLVRAGTEKAEDEYAEFKGILEARGADFEPELLDGEYSYFNVLPDGTFEIAGVTLEDGDQLIAFTYTQGSEDLNNRVNNFALADFSIEILGYDGSRFVNTL
ncbi:MAG TPA: hypothetical protein DCE41_09455 [Cytophagales bacterium]|nr:hypothetical protein [Cytophagales bacterium]HAA22482.1 hypothetical protein [Cytophagales bacterium]HAP61585.1 hypothetical protein [Cytophagales bacterium]